MTFDEEVIHIVELVNVSGRTKELVDMAFEINNKRWARASKKWCGGCVARVFKRLTDHYNYLKKQNA